MVQIKFLDNSDNVVFYVSRIAICTASPPFASVMPSKRSWPCIIWRDMCHNHLKVECDLDLWYYLSHYIEYLYTNQASNFSAQNISMEWMAFLAKILEDLHVYNVCMKCCFEGYGRTITPNEGQKLLDCVIESKTARGHSLRESYNNRKLVTYLVDNMIWESIYGRPERNPCKLNKNLEEFIQNRKSEALAEPPNFPPYHVSNQHKYLTRVPATEIVKSEPGSKRVALKCETSPDASKQHKKRARSDDSIIGGDRLAKKEAVDTEAVIAHDINMKQGEEAQAKLKEVIEVKKGESSEGPKVETMPTKVAKGEVKVEPVEVEVIRSRRVKKYARKDIYDVT